MYLSKIISQEKKFYLISLQDYMLIYHLFIYHWIIDWLIDDLSCYMVYWFLSSFINSSFISWNAESSTQEALCEDSSQQTDLGREGMYPSKHGLISLTVKRQCQSRKCAPFHVYSIQRIENIDGRLRFNKWWLIVFLQKMYKVSTIWKMKYRFCFC